MQLVFTSKFCDTYWKLLGWIVYISLLATSVWFTWGVIENFSHQDTAIKQYENKIEAHPTIAICSLNPSEWKYQRDFYITYTTYESDGSTVEDELVLKLGGNDLENSGENVTLTTIYTRYIARKKPVKENRPNLRACRMLTI